jgi:hypothetical protein
MGGDIYALPPSLAGGETFCGCTTGDDCLNGKVCMDVSILCALGGMLEPYAAFIDLICPGGNLSPKMPPHLCASLDDLLGTEE